jgi:nucleotide-binding universal stress UspA family protein
VKGKTMQIKNILVPVDFSECSDHAVEYALYLAEKYEAEMTLLHVIVLFQGESHKKKKLDDYEELVREKEKSGLDKINALHKNAGNRGVTVNSEVARDITEYQAILEFIAGNNIDLVVMGTHGRTGIKKWIYGSVAEKIVRLSPAPVLTIQHDDDVREFKINKILAPVDFSDYSKKAVEVAATIAGQFEAGIEFLHVIADPVPLGYHEVGIEGLYTFDQELTEKSLKHLKEFVGRTGSNYMYTILEGIPYMQISEHARTTQTDLIVMATRGKSGLQHFLVGSTTERVVPLAPCPVLTVERESAE